MLDDTEYKPAIHRRPPGLNNAAPGIITAAPVTHGDIFDVTVTAIQGPGGEVNGTNGGQAFVYPGNSFQMSLTIFSFSFRFRRRCQFF